MIPQIKIGRWVIVTEDGIWSTNEDWTYPSKKLAIEEYSICNGDERPTPKVKKMCKGEYWYYPKFEGRLCSPITIALVTEENIEYLQNYAKEQWESDPLSQYD